MVARAVKVSDTPIFTSNMQLVTTETRRKILAGAGAFTKRTVRIETSRNAVWDAQLVRTLRERERERGRVVHC